MRITKPPVVGVLLGLSLVAACRNTGNNSMNPDGARNTDVGEIHIQDVQSDAMPPGTAVELHGVIVTAIDTFGSKLRQDMWIEEPGGGERSGVHVFRPPTSQIANLVVGDIIDLTGASKTEFHTTGDTTGRTVTELQAPSGGMMTVMKTGTGTVPDPVIVDAVALEAMSQADRDAVYEKWEGVLIKVQNVRALGAPTNFGGTSNPIDSFGVEVNGKLVMDSNLAMFPNAIDGSTCFANVTGVEDYIASNWVIYPRTTAEIVTGGNGCPASTVTPTTISAIQATTPTGTVELDSVNVMGLTNNSKSFWLSTSLTAAPNEGVFVFQQGTLDPGVVPGALVKVIGTVQEFNDDTLGGTLTEVLPSQIVVTAGAPGTPIAITGLTVAALLNATNAPKYESVLVTLDNVAITALGAGANGFVATANQNTTIFSLGTDIIRLAAADLGCYQSITGFWSNLEAAGSAATTKPNAYGFIPLTLTGKGLGTCN
jgi:predicted extracellular nuclease